MNKYDLKKLKSHPGVLRLYGIRLQGMKLIGDGTYQVFAHSTMITIRLSGSTCMMASGCGPAFRARAAVRKLLIPPSALLLSVMALAKLRQ